MVSDNTEEDDVHEDVLLYRSEDVQHESGCDFYFELFGTDEEKVEYIKVVEIDNEEVKEILDVQYNKALKIY